MTKFVRWLRYVGLWVRRMPVAPHYWSAVAVVVTCPPSAVPMLS